MKILHLSDIHFGRNYARTKITDPFEKRDEYDEAYEYRNICDYEAPIQE